MLVYNDEKTEVRIAMNDPASGEARSTRSMSTAELLREQSECVKQLLAENSTLRQQLAAANERLAAGVKFCRLSKCGSSGIEITKIHAGWSVYITHYGNFGPREGRHGLFESLDEALSSLVSANWLPKE